MAYTGTGILPGSIYSSPGLADYSGTRFNDQATADAFGKVLQLSGQGLQAGQFFTGEGGTQYKTVAGIDPNQPGWGQRVEPGWELIGYQQPERYTGKAYEYGARGDKTPGFAILQKKMEAPPPVPDASSVETNDEVIDSNAAAADKNVAEAETTLSMADQLKIMFDDYEKRLDARDEQQRELLKQSQQTFASNLSRSQMTPNLQIMPAGQTPDIAGTQGFKIRKPGSSSSVTGTILSGLNLGQPSMMNV